MTFTITKEFAFSASHQLVGLAPGHQCGRLHGHNYVVVVELTGELDGHGFVVDFGDLGIVKHYIDTELDHRHLNEVLPDLANPTAELLAELLYRRFSNLFPEVTAVRVSETPKTWAEYRP